MVTRRTPRRGLAAGRLWRSLPPRRLGLPGRRGLPALAATALLAVGLPLALTSAPPAPEPPAPAAPEPPAPAAPESPAPRPSVVLPPSAGDEQVVLGAQTGPGTPRGDMRRITLDVGGMERSYLLLPALGLDAGEPSALLVVLHHEVSSGRQISVDLGLDSLRRHGITLAYPNGHGGSWNSGACCGVAMEQGVDDVAFVNTVLEDVARHVPVDPDRRALLGYSGGGMLAYRVLCGEHPPLLAAVEINGSLEAPCDESVQLPELLSVHGADDGSIGLTDSRYVNHLKMAPRSVRSTLETVARLAGCGTRVATTENGIDVWRWQDCRDGGAVEAHIVPDAGHGWADVGAAPRALAWLLPRLAAR